MSDRALIVFLKHPRPGGVKTRLVLALGAEVAAELYRALAESILQATVPQTGEYERLVFFDPPEASEAVRAWLPGLRLLAQSGEDLGARMADAFDRAFRRGATRVVIVGTDAPGVSRETAIEAFQALDEADVVVGPAEDGGYYLLGLKARRPDLFEGVDWSTPEVLDQTRARVAAAGLTMRELRRRCDVDTLDDLRAEWPALRRLLKSRPEVLAAVEDALRVG